MRYLLGVVITLIAVSGFVYAQNPAPAPPTAPLSKATFIDHAKVAEVLAKGGNLVSASDVIVLGSHRDKAGQVEVHDTEMDVIYVIDGTATFVTGGKIVGAKSSRANQWLGTDITGGTPQKLVKGDVILVPAGMPHWFKEVPTTVSYFVVKVVKPCSDADSTWLFTSLIPGGIGFVLFVYGRKQQRWPHLVAGLLFMVYPYFTTSVVSLVAAGAVLGLVLWYAVRLGW